MLSGINHGGNLGCDLYISGTAALRGSAYHRVRSAAVSHYLRRGVPLDWNAAARRAAAALSEAIDRHDPLGEREFWSINLPHPDPGDPEPAVRLCPVSREPLPVAYTQEAGGFRYGGVYAERPREAGSDVDQCFGGAITLSRVPL
ncbi:MAG: 5'/3'-nucleotidase SurE [Verrucomicrobiales bacterium]